MNYNRKACLSLMACKRVKRKSLVTRTQRPMKQEFAPFLESTDIVDWKHPKVLAMARELAGGWRDETQKARRLFEWVRDVIRHSHDYKLNPVTCTASEVLEQGTGFCYAKSHLLVALFRASGLPAGFCYQRRKVPGWRNYLHGYCAVQLPEAGWYHVDPRGNKPDVDAQFTPPAEKLAYEIGQEGEWDDPRVRARPLAEVVKALRTHKTWDEMLEHTPDPPFIPPLE